MGEHIEIVVVVSFPPSILHDGKANEKLEHHNLMHWPFETQKLSARGDLHHFL